MFLNPVMMGLILCQGFSCIVLSGASIAGIHIAAGWDLSSPALAQGERERKTSLVSMAVALAAGCEIFSLFFLVAAADHIHGLFYGAMCAAGTLNANPFGYPALALKAASVLACGTWLVLNRADGLVRGYPLLRVKYAVLPGIGLLAVAETVVLSLYVAGLAPQIITSCCGVQFDQQGPGWRPPVPVFAPDGTRIVFFAALAWTLGAGTYVLKTGKGALIYGLSALAMFPVSIAAIVSFISCSFYELPTHHCPFCLLQAEYGRVGYVLYAALIAGVVLGAGVAALELARSRMPVEMGSRLRKRLCLASLTAFAVFGAVASWPLVFSGFKMGGY